MKPTAPRTVDGNNLLDYLIEKMNLKNDAALSRAIGVKPPVISKIRHRVLGVSGDMKIIIYKKTGTSIEDIEGLLGLNQTADES